MGGRFVPSIERTDSSNQIAKARCNLHAFLENNKVFVIHTSSVVRSSSVKLMVTLPGFVPMHGAAPKPIGTRCELSVFTERNGPRSRSLHLTPDEKFHEAL